MAIDSVRDIRDGIEAAMQAYLGADYKKLTYVNDVNKNNFNANSDRYGARPLFGAEVPGVTKNVHITQSFEVVLSKAYKASSLNDTEQSEKALDNLNNMLSIYKELVNTKCGIPSVVLNVTNLQMSEPEYLTESKVAVQRATVDVTYRYSLI